MGRRTRPAAPRRGRLAVPASSAGGRGAVVRVVLPASPDRGVGRDRAVRPSGPLDSSGCAPSGSATGCCAEVGHDERALAAVRRGDGEGDDLLGPALHPGQRAGAERPGTSGGEQRAVQLQRGALDAVLLVDGQGGVARRLRQPGLVRGAEAQRRGVRRPTASARGTRRGRARCARSAPSSGPGGGGRACRSSRAGRAPRPGTGRTSPAARASARSRRGRAAGPARRPAAGRRCRCRWGGGCRRAGRGARRGARRRGWTAPTWSGRRRSRWPRSEDSTTARICGASHGACRKSKLNAWCISVART